MVSCATYIEYFTNIPCLAGQGTCVTRYWTKNKFVAFSNFKRNDNQVSMIRSVNFTDTLFDGFEYLYNFYRLHRDEVDTEM